MTSAIAVVNDRPITIRFMEKPWPTGYTDPCIFHGDSFVDRQFRVLMNNNNTGNREMWTSPDLETWTLSVADWLPGEPAGSGLDTFQDYVLLPSGTFVLYQNDGVEQSTAVWVGTAADVADGTVTRLGRVLDEGDCGAFYDEDTDTIHIFTENPATPHGAVSSSSLNHFTTTSNDLLTPTAHGVAVDAEDAWGTGDPCFFKWLGSYWMFCDYSITHPTYYGALFRSDDLYTWEQVSSEAAFTEFTGMLGGDFDCIVVGERVFCFTEYTGGGGVGRWEIEAAPGTTRLTPTVGAARAVITT